MKIYPHKQFLSCITCFIILIFTAGCKKAIDTGVPVTQLSSTNVFTSNGTAQGAISGIMASMCNVNSFYNGFQSISVQQGLGADELVNYSASSVITNQFYTNSLNSQGTYYWQTMYGLLYTCNAAIQGLTQATQLTPAIRQQLLGEAQFLRAYIYFYAVNLYGDVPLAITTDYTVNNVISRSPVVTIYEQIIKDLKDAQNLLPDNKYLNGTGGATTDRVRPNKQAASALLARVYLYQKDWQNAEIQATSVIGASTYVLEPNLAQVFLKGTREAIFQLQPVQPGYNNADATVLVIAARPNGILSQLSLSSSLVNAFEPGDARFTSWVGVFNAPAGGGLPAANYYFANKYKQYLINNTAAATEYPILLRFSEQYLIRAEARAQQGNVTGAQSDLNVIRKRAGLANTTAATQTDLLTAVLHERQVELFTEWGHRWFDLKRTGALDALMSVVTPQKGGSWTPSDQLMPLPDTEILINSHLTQNPGY